MAAGWASALGVDLCIVTVAEPTLAALDDRPIRRSHGPDGDPQAYVAALTNSWRGAGLNVSGLAIYDPIGAAQGLATELESSPCGLLAVTTHARRGLRRRSVDLRRRLVNQQPRE